MDDVNGVAQPSVRVFEGKENMPTMEIIFKSLDNVDFDGVYAKLCTLNGLQRSKVAVQLVMNKASELYLALNELTIEENIDPMNETRLFTAIPCDAIGTNARVDAGMWIRSEARITIATTVAT